MRRAVSFPRVLKEPRGAFCFLGGRPSLAPKKRGLGFASLASL